MKLLIHCTDKYLRQSLDQQLRKEKNFIITFADVVGDYNFDRVIFCQENKSLFQEVQDKQIKTVFFGQVQDLTHTYDAVYFWHNLKTVVDTLYESKQIPTKFTATTITKILPKLFASVRKGKQGHHYVADEQTYSGAQIAEAYGLTGVELGPEVLGQVTDPLEQSSELVIKNKALVNIYIPTYYRFEKTKKSILTLLETALKGKHDYQLYIGDNNTKEEEMKQWLKSLPHAKVLFSPENMGKANMVNLLHSKARASDYIFSIDSDMVVESQPNHPFDKMIECLEKCDNAGLISSDQKLCNQHWYNRGLVQFTERNFKVAESPNCVGVAGGCIVMRTSDWDQLGGYKKNHDIYTGDDGILTYNTTRKLGKRVLVCQDSWLHHPYPGEDEKGYTEWKAKSWHRDGLNFIKDNYTGANKKGYYD